MSFRYYLIIFLALLPASLLRDFNPGNELRYLSIADETLKNGHLFTFTNHGHIYADKPPLYLWIVMLGKCIFGMHNILFLSLFSILPAFIIIYLMDKWVGKYLSKTSRIACALMLITSVFFIGGTVVLRMDMLMCMFITLALFTFHKLYKDVGGKYDQWLFGFYVFMAVFTKGPVGLLIPLLSTIAFLTVQKEMRTIGKYWGWRTLTPLFICFGIWFCMVWLEGGNAYLNNLLFNQTVNRAVDSFRHKEPFYYYVVTIWHSLAPWSLLFVSSIVIGVRKKLITTDLERFFLIIISTCLIFLSLISSKTGIYLLPSYPFIAYLAVIILSKINWNKWVAISIGIPTVLIISAAPAAIILGMKYLESERVLWIYLIAATVLLVASGIVTLHFLYRKKNIVLAGSFLAGGLLATIFTIGLATPFLNNRIGYRELCAKGIALSKKKETPLYCIYKLSRGENIDVYLGTNVEEISYNDILSSKYAGSVLFTSQKALKKDQILFDFLKTKKQRIVGDNLVIQL